MPDAKVYLGDGVYAKWVSGWGDYWDLVLTTEDGIRTTNCIVLEPAVFGALLEYVDRAKRASQMNRCATCRYWVLDKTDEYNRILFPLRPGTEDDWDTCQTEEEVTAAFGHRVRRCRAPKLLFYQRPERDGAAVVDGSRYKAELLTAEDFGCVLHEPIRPSEAATRT